MPPPRTPAYYPIDVLNSCGDLAQFKLSVKELKFYPLGLVSEKYVYVEGL